MYMILLIAEITTPLYKQKYVSHDIDGNFLGKDPLVKP